MGADLQSTITQQNVTRVLDLRANKPIVIVGMMGAGKSTVGRRVAQFLGLEFIDSDDEIETAAGMPIADIFETHGEEEFRAGEMRVISRLLRTRKDAVIATGGGAFINETTRKNVKKHAISVWLNAELDLLFERVSRRNTRPLLRTADPYGTLKALAEARAPFYAEADIDVMSSDTTHEKVAQRIIDTLAEHLEQSQ